VATRKTLAHARWFQVLKGTMIICVLYVSISASTSAACDLSPLVLPERTAPITLNDSTMNVQIGARIDFQNSQDKLYAITETSYPKIASAETVISDLIKPEVRDLPNDPCGTRATLGEVSVGTTPDNLTVNLPLSGEQWGCGLGIKGQLASGTLMFQIVFTPLIADNKVTFTSIVSPHTGELLSTVPNIDTSLTEEIDDAINKATLDAINSVKNTVSVLQSRLDNMQSDIPEPADPIKAIYHPKITSFQFRQEGSSILLIQKRQTETREGTTCAIRRLAAEKWISF
jgi:hypothetical protein